MQGFDLELVFIRKKKVKKVNVTFGFTAHPWDLQKCNN